MHNKLVGLLSIAIFLAVPAAEARRNNQYFIPPPPPTPVLIAPPQPVQLPYSEAYAPAPAPTTMVPPPAVRQNPNFLGLSLTDARARGFGKPRLPYNAGYGPGAAIAMPYKSAPAMNTWFDPSLRWYANHANASNYYDSLANQAPYFTPDYSEVGSSRSAQAPALHSQRQIRKPKRVVAYR